MAGSRRQSAILYSVPRARSRILPAFFIPHFVEFYIKSELQGGSIMSRILPSALQAVKEQDIDVIAAVADRTNYAARKVLERSGFAVKEQFDFTKDLFQTP